MYFRFWVRVWENRVPVSELEFGKTRFPFRSSSLGKSGSRFGVPVWEKQVAVSEFEFGLAFARLESEQRADFCSQDPDTDRGERKKLALISRTGDNGILAYCLCALVHVVGAKMAFGKDRPLG